MTGKLLLLVLVACAPPLHAQQNPIPAGQPIQTELLHALDASRLKPGSPVIAKVLHHWSGPGCTLASGSTASGIVVQASVDKATHRSGITLRFDTADCNGKLGSHLPMRVLALVLTEPEARERAFTANGGLYGNFSSPGQLTISGRLDIYRSPVEAKREVPKVVKDGEVYGDKKMSLEGSGGDGTTTLSTTNHNLRLEQGVTLMLMPQPSPLSAEVAASSADAETIAAAIADAPASTPFTPSALASSTLPLPLAPLILAPRDETDVCSQTCTVETAGTLSRNAVPAPKSAQTIPMSLLGYSLLERHQLFSFHHAHTLTYLGATRLLFTFDLHSIRIRRTGGLRPEYAHTVRAVLIDPATRAIKRIVDWQVMGEDQYLWPAAPGRILVHLGQQLRLLDADLQPVETYDLPAPLTWVSAAPAGDTFAVGLLRERHTEELHRKLVDMIKMQPEESVEVAFLDGGLKPLGSSTQPSGVAPPVLTTLGELRAVAQERHQWALEEFGRDNTRRRIAVTVSDCEPRVSLPTPDTLFLASCASGENWYRVLRWDGHPILRGSPSSREFEQAAEGDATNDAFAIRVVWNDSSRNNDGPIYPADLRGEQIAVYRKSDGKRLLMSDLPNVPLTEQSFALSPDARQLAVMGIDSIYLFAVYHAN